MTMTTFRSYFCFEELNYNMKLRGSLFFYTKKRSEPLIYKEKLKSVV